MDNLKNRLERCYDDGTIFVPAILSLAPFSEKVFRRVKTHPSAKVSQSVAGAIAVMGSNIVLHE